MADDLGTSTYSESEEEEEDTTERFAADLRRLRLQADSPTLARLHHDTGISRTVLSDAFAGRTLPTARTVDGIVQACDAEPAEWLDRRDRLAAALAERRKPAGQARDAAPPPSSSPTMPRGAAVWLAVAAFVVGAVMSAAVGAVVSAQLRPAAATAPEIKVADARASEITPQIIVDNGEDPAFTRCVDDAKVATADSRQRDTLIEIIWSNKCYAGWARITRYDAEFAGNTVMIAIYPETAEHGPDRQEATEHGVQGAYTTLVVRPSPDTLLCAVGSFTVDGETIDLGEPICI